jgi:hypothetical protein
MEPSFGKRRKGFHMIQGRVSAWSVVIVLVLAGEASAIDNSWYFTAEQIEVAYRYQQNFGKRLRSPLKPHDCYYGKTEFVAQFPGTVFLAPCRFIDQITRHLKTMIEKGAARYLFPLDADHAHLAIPVDLWRNIYSGLHPHQLLPRILREPAFVALSYR